MADSATLKLGNLISSKITGSLESFGSGMKGAFISANPATFGPMVGALSKGFNSLNAQSQKEARKQREDAQRAQGFAEERANEQKKYEQILLSLQKGMASNIEAMQKDVRKILELMMKKEEGGILSSLANLLKSLAIAIPSTLTNAIDEIAKFFKSIPERITGAIDDLIRFLNSIPSRLTGAFDGIVKMLQSIPDLLMRGLKAISDFVQSIPSRLGTMFDNVGKFIDEIAKKFPNTLSALNKLFSNLSDILKLDKFAEFGKTIASKLNNLVNLLGESDIAKAFRRVRNIFAISFAQFADEMEDIFNNRIMRAFGSIKASIDTLGTRITGVIDDAFTSFKNSKMVSVADEMGTKFTNMFTSFFNYVRETKIGSIGEDVANTIKGFLTDFRSLLGIPNLAELTALFDMGKYVQTFDEFKYLLGETGLIGKVVTTIGTITGVISSGATEVMSFFSKIGDLFSGPLKLLSELSGIDDLLKGARAITPFLKGVLGPLGVIFTIIDGVMASFDTKMLSEAFGKAENQVTIKDRIAGFFGGVLGGIFGLFDLIGNIMGFSTEKEGKSLQERVTLLATKFTGAVMSGIGNLVDILVGLVTLDFAKVKDAGADLTDLVSKSFKMLGNVMIDSINWLIDKLPEFMRPDKIARLDTGPDKGYTDEATRLASRYPAKAGPSTGNAPPVSPEAAAMMNRQGGRYVQSDLKKLGLNIKEGDVQRSGAQISPSTISGAQWVQANVPGVTFTGFNDAYHDQHSPASSHTKGLAFDFVIPRNLAMDDDRRKAIAAAIASSTGGYVIDEYAYPSAKSTGGHFHVDFASSKKGVQLGTGTFGGLDKQIQDAYSSPSRSLDVIQTSPSVESSVGYGLPSGAAFDGGNFDATPAVMLPQGTASGGNVGAGIPVVVVPVNKYQQERERLQNQFTSQLEGIFRPIVNALQGPAGSFGPESMVNAGKNMSKFLRDDFEKLGTKLFGKQYGAAIGGTFQELAGVYLNQFISESLAPALGMNANILNRSINTYIKGVELLDPKLKQANQSLEKSREELKTYIDKNKDISLAEIVTAAGKGGFSAEQKQRIGQLTTLRENLKKNEAAVASLSDQKKQYKNAALEDLFYGMTGISLGPRTMLDQYAGGAEGLTKDLAQFFGAPFKPAFGLSDKDAVAYKKLEAEAKLNENTVLAQAKVNENFLEAQARLYQNEIIPAMRDAVSGADTGGVRFGGGTAIPGYTGPTYISSGANVDEYGIPIQDGFNFFGQKTGSSSAGNRLMDFGQNMIYNLVGSKISSSLGGGVGASLLGRAATGALRGAFTGKGTIAQNIGAQFGLKLGPEAGVMDAVSGIFNSMNPVAGISKAGMNMMQSLMPQGASGPLGQFGFDFFSGMGSSGNFMSNLGNAMSQGGSFMGSFGANAAGTGMNIGNFAGQAAGMAGSVFSGMQYGNIAKNLIGGKYQVSKGLDTFYKVGSAVASAFMGPIGGAIVGAVGGLVNRAFGRKPKEITGSRLEGTLSGSGTEVKSYQDWFQKGGWFRSDKRGSELQEMSDDVLKSFSDMTTGIVENSNALLKSLGGTTTNLSDIRQQLSIAFGKDDTEQQKLEKITKAFEAYQETLLKTGNSTLELYKDTSETITDTATRLSRAIETSTPILSSLGFIGNRGISKFFGSDITPGQALLTSFGAKLSDLQTAFGGVDQFQTEFGKLVSKMFSPEEASKINLVTLHQEFLRYSEKFGGAGGIQMPTSIPDDPAVARTTAQTKFRELRDKMNRGEITNAQFADGIRAINAYLLTTDQKSMMGVTGQAIFDAGQFIPKVDELGTVITDVTRSITNTFQNVLDDAYAFVNSIGGVDTPSDIQARIDQRPGGGAAGGGAGGGAAGGSANTGTTNVTTNTPGKTLTNAAGYKIVLNRDNTAPVAIYDPAGNIAQQYTGTFTDTANKNRFDISDSFFVGRQKLDDKGAPISGSIWRPTPFWYLGADKNATEQEKINLYMSVFEYFSRGLNLESKTGQAAIATYTDIDKAVRLAIENPLGKQPDADWNYLRRKTYPQYHLWTMLPADWYSRSAADKIKFYNDNAVTPAELTAALKAGGEPDDKIKASIEYMSKNGYNVKDLAPTSSQVTGPNSSPGGAGGVVGGGGANIRVGGKYNFQPVIERAQGGSVIANSPYIIGEVGPEIFVPTVNGTIVSTDQIINALTNASDIDSQTRNLLKSSIGESSVPTNAVLLNLTINVGSSSSTTKGTVGITGTNNNMNIDVGVDPAYLTSKFFDPKNPYGAGRAVTKAFADIFEQETGMALPDLDRFGGRYTGMLSTEQGRRTFASWLTNRAVNTGEGKFYRPGEHEELDFVPYALENYASDFGGGNSMFIPDLFDIDPTSIAPRMYWNADTPEENAAVGDRIQRMMYAQHMLGIGLGDARALSIDMLESRLVSHNGILDRVKNYNTVDWKSEFSTVRGVSGGSTAESGDIIRAVLGMETGRGLISYDQSQAVVFGSDAKASRDLFQSQVAIYESQTAAARADLEKYKNLQLNDPMKNDYTTQIQNAESSIKQYSDLAELNRTRVAEADARIQSFLPTINSINVSDAESAGLAAALRAFYQGLAGGGSFKAGRPYIVGEVGPELMIPNFAGTVVPTHRILEAVQDAASLDSKTRNLLSDMSPNANPVVQVFLDQQSMNRSLSDELRDISVNSALVDNSVTTVSSPNTNIINRGDDVRSRHPVAGLFTRSMSGART